MKQGSLPSFWIGLVVGILFSILLFVIIIDGTQERISHDVADSICQNITSNPNAWNDRTDDGLKLTCRIPSTKNAAYGIIIKSNAEELQ